MTVSGYKVERQPDGLTVRERAVLDGTVAGKSFAEIGRELGVSRQRVGQLVDSLVSKEFLIKVGGAYALVVKR